MFCRIQDFIAQWAYESEATLKVFNSLTDESLAQRVTEDGRTLGRIAWHIVLTLGEMLGRAGLTPDAPDEDSEVPETVSEIVEAYKKAADSLIEQIKQQWTDESLAESVEMYGEIWKKGSVLVSLIRHQVHHRGQMTVLMRQAGLKVPGVYGPSREEWQSFGLPPMP